MVCGRWCTEPDSSPARLNAVPLAPLPGFPEVGRILLQIPALKRFILLFVFACLLNPLLQAQSRDRDGDLRQDIPLQPVEPATDTLPKADPVPEKPTAVVTVKTLDDEPYTPEQPDFWSLDRVLVGGGFSAGFGTVISLDVSPTVMYHLTGMMRFGVGMSYRYFNDTRDFFAFKANVLGGRAILQHDILLGFFAHAEYEYMRARYFEGDNPPAQINFPTALLGGGYAIPLGGGSSVGGGMLDTKTVDDISSMMQIQVLYPVSLNSGYSLYGYDIPIEFRLVVLIQL